MEAVALFAEQPPVATDQQPTRAAPAPGAREVRMEAPYAAYLPSAALIEAPLPAHSPLYAAPGPSVDADEYAGQSFAGRLQSPLGFSGGAYALNSAFDAGSPRGEAASDLPGLRDGLFRFSQRLKSQGDQGVIDTLLRAGGTYLSVNQAPYIKDDRPAGR